MKSVTTKFVCDECGGSIVTDRPEYIYKDGWYSRNGRDLCPSCHGIKFIIKLSADNNNENYISRYDVTDVFTWEQWMKQARCFHVTYPQGRKVSLFLPIFEDVIKDKELLKLLNSGISPEVK